MSFTILQLVHMDETGDSYYRMRWPARELAQQNPDWRVINLDAAATERFDWAVRADLLVLFQSQDLDFIPIMEKRRKLGKKTLVEYNDNFYAPPPASPVYEAWSAPSIHAAYEEIMQAGDALIVTGPGLQDLFSKKTEKAIHILENHLPECPPAFDSVWNNEIDSVHLGWAGSIGHLSDLLSILPVLRKLMAKYPQLHFHVMGNEVLPNYLFMPSDRVHYHPWGGMKEYYEFWQPVQLGVIPLLDTPYNQCRSDIKPIEMGSRGVLPILQVQTPYRELAREQDLPIFDSEATLYQQLESSILDLSRARQKTEDFHQYISENRVSSARMERSELYRALLPKKSESYSWELGLGCHEVEGREKSNSFTVDRTVKVQQLMKSNQYQEAMHLLSEGPISLDLKLLRLQILSKLDKQGFEGELQSALQSHQDEIRVRLLQVESMEEVEAQLEGWKTLLEDLSSKPKGLRETLKPLVVRFVLRMLQGSAAFIPVGEACLSIYPDLAKLRFLLARRYDESNESEKALEQYRWLLHFHEQACSSAEFILSFDRRELLSVVEGLEARCS